MNAAIETASPQLDVAGVHCAIGKRVVVADARFTVPGGSRFAIVGANGAGKSTLLKVLAGINPAQSGAVHLDGVALTAMKSGERARRIAFVGQEELPPDDLNVTELVTLGRVPHRPPWAGGGETETTIVADALSRVNLTDKALRLTGQLSGGERRRALLARGLAQQTTMLMLDEPTNHLDVQWQLKLLAILADYMGTVIAAVHDLDVVWRYFDHVAVIHDGTVVAAGPTQQVLTQKLIRAAFGVSSTIARNNVTGEDHLLTFQTSR